MTARSAFCRDYSIIFQFVLQKSRYPPSYLHIIFPLLPTASIPATPCSKHIVLFPHLSHYLFLWITKNVWLCFVTQFRYICKLSNMSSILYRLLLHSLSVLPACFYWSISLLKYYHYVEKKIVWNKAQLTTVFPFYKSFPFSEPLHTDAVKSWWRFFFLECSIKLERRRILVFLALFFFSFLFKLLPSFSHSIMAKYSMSHSTTLLQNILNYWPS